MRPTRIHKAAPAELEIVWDDNHRGRHTFSTLRKYCPCASCKSEADANEGKVLLPILKPGEFELKGIEPIGAYAILLRWGDGHRTGIYTYDYLRQMCECHDCAGASPDRSIRRREVQPPR